MRYVLSFSLLFMLTSLMVGAKLPVKHNTVFPATVTKVTDGDTFHAVLGLGRNVQLSEVVRVYNYDAPELRAYKDLKEKELAIKAKAYAEGLLSGRQVTLKTHGVDKYGRLLGDVTLDDGKDFATLMKAQGFVK